MSAFALPVSETVLRALALHVANGDHHLAEELAQHVRVQHWRGLFDPARSQSFAAWASVCMRRYRLDTFRNPIRAVGGVDPLPDAPDRRDDSAACEQLADLTAPLGPADTATVRRWRPLDRVVLLCRALLWQKVPADLWHETTAALGLPPDFPGEGFEHLTRTERIRMLSRALKTSTSNLSHIWKRGQPRLRALQCVRDLVRG